MEIKFIIFLLLHLQSILNVVNISMAEPLYSEIVRCKTNSGTIQPNSPYKTNLMSTLKDLATKIEKNPFFAIQSAGNKPNESVTAVALCARYLKPNDCVSCVKKTITLLQQKCPTQKAAASWRVTCMVRYGAPVVLDYDLWFVAHETSDAKVKDVKEFEKIMPMMVKNVSREVYSADRNNDKDNYAYGMQIYNSGKQTLHMVMQCTLSSPLANCEKCLNQISGEIKTCCNGAVAAAVLTPNCYMRYAHADFRVL